MFILNIKKKKNDVITVTQYCVISIDGQIYN